jgi:hypothetical protein
MNQINRLNTALDNGLVKEVFDQVRNYLMCGFLPAIGVIAFEQNTGLRFGRVAAGAFNYSGVWIIGLSFILFCLNLVDRVRKISKYKFGRTFSVILIVLYIVVSVRVIELAWYFRTI